MLNCSSELTPFSDKNPKTKIKIESSPDFHKNTETNNFMISWMITTTNQKNTLLFGIYDLKLNSVVSCE